MTNPAPLKVAVVGHTNTGKTSLMRTLLRDENFGEVSDRPAVTREVEGSMLLVNGRPAMELYDTPGLEDSIGLLDHLNAMRADRRVEGIEVMQRFLESPEAKQQFSQEAKALRQVLASDMALYVIDARDRVLGKHRDELEILSMCARPVVPVLNFIAKPEARTNEWRDHLARVNLHAVAEFDTVVVDELSEQRLFEKMRTLLDRFAPTFDALIEDRKRLREQIIASSASIIADMLIDVAAYRIPVERLDKPLIEKAVEQLRRDIRAREQKCLDQLLELHRFRHEDCASDELPIVDGRWGIDLFNPDAMKQFGIKAGGGAAAGAMAGLLFDIFTGGLTLGAGTATGAAIGAAIGGQSHGRRIIDKIRGRTELYCDDATLALLEARQVHLLKALLHRGHAAQQPLHLEAASRAREPVVADATARPSAPRLPEPLRLARSRPAWSTITPAPPPAASAHLAEVLRTKPTTDPHRDTAQHELAAEIERAIERH